MDGDDFELFDIFHFFSAKKWHLVACILRNLACLIQFHQFRCSLASLSGATSSSKCINFQNQHLSTHATKETSTVNLLSTKGFKTHIHAVYLPLRPTLLATNLQRFLPCSLALPFPIPLVTSAVFFLIFYICPKTTPFRP